MTFSDNFSYPGWLEFTEDEFKTGHGDWEPNVLGVFARGPDISLYINGQVVASFSVPITPLAQSRSEYFPISKAGL